MCSSDLAPPRGVALSAVGPISVDKQGGVGKRKGMASRVSVPRLLLTRPSDHPRSRGPADRRCCSRSWTRPSGRDRLRRQREGDNPPARAPTTTLTASVCAAWNEIPSRHPSFSASSPSTSPAKSLRDSEELDARRHPVPSAHDRARNRHRCGTAWSKSAGAGHPGKPPLHGLPGLESAAARRGADRRAGRCAGS